MSDQDTVPKPGEDTPHRALGLMFRVALAVSVITTTGGVVYAIAVPQHGEEFSSVYLQPSTNAGDTQYPSTISPDGNTTLTVGIHNYEHERMSYTIVAKLQRVEREGNDTTVLESSKLHRFEATLAHDEQWERSHSVNPEMTGRDLRLLYLVYRGDAPSGATSETAYDSVFLYVNVTA